MAHFAQVDENNIVTQVIVIDQETLNTGLWGDPNTWIQTSYNTRGGVHILGGTPLRKNFAGVGMTYDEKRDAFIPKKEFDSWVLNEGTCLWEPPVPHPNSNGEGYKWNESTTSCLVSSMRTDCACE